MSKEICVTCDEDIKELPCLKCGNSHFRLFYNRKEQTLIAICNKCEFNQLVLQPVDFMDAREEVIQ